jgi:hypothetical protein
MDDISGIGVHAFTIDDQPIPDTNEDNGGDPICIHYCRPVVEIHNNKIDISYDSTHSGIYTNYNDIDTFVESALAGNLRNPDKWLSLDLKDRLGFFCRDPSFVVIHPPQQFIKFARGVPAVKTQLLPDGKYWTLQHILSNGENVGTINDTSGACELVYFSADLYGTSGDRFNIYMELLQDGQYSLLKLDPDIKNDGSKPLFREKYGA